MIVKEDGVLNIAGERLSLQGVTWHCRTVVVSIESSTAAKLTARLSIVGIKDH